MKEHDFKYVFGPVASRRLGRSLGVDVVPFKTCPYDCVYCQLGRTTNHTATLAEYAPLTDLLNEIQLKIEDGVEADYITIAGSGEPTLYSEMTALIAGIKRLTRIPIAVITNGALFWRKEIRDALQGANLVVPSLDAGFAESFERVNRPCGGITFDHMVEGLIEFRKEFHGQIWLEAFLLGGVTDTDAEADRIEEIVARMQPDKVQLNTVARPAPDGDVIPAPPERLRKIAERIGPNAEVVAHYESRNEAVVKATTTKEVLGVIRRHPCSLADVARGLGAAEKDVAQRLADLETRGVVTSTIRDGEAFYMAARKSDGE
jgi:wyosine [tRNA(Phe)-imidazoG37] synthetase (radical SAM superfamily)